MKAKNATPGTRIQHKISGQPGRVLACDSSSGDAIAAVRWDASQRYEDVHVADLRRLGQVRVPYVTVRRGGVRYRQPRPAYLLPGVHEDTDPYLAERVRELGAEFGPAVVAIVAAQMTDPNYLIARLLNTGYQPPQRGTEQQPDMPGPTDGAAPADEPASGEAVLRLLPVPDAELLCVVRNTGRVPIAVYDATDDRVTAVAPGVTLEVPRSWASVACGETVRGFGEADESDPADRMRVIADAAWTEGYEACRDGQQPHSPYREPRPASR